MEAVETPPAKSGSPARTQNVTVASDIVGIAANDRPRSGNTPSRWLGRFSNYIQDGAYRFPRHGKIAWDLPEGEFVYWGGDIQSLTGVGIE